MLIRVYTVYHFRHYHMGLLNVRISMVRRASRGTSGPNTYIKFGICQVNYVIQLRLQL